MVLERKEISIAFFPFEKASGQAGAVAHPEYV
jgi:hypothetical protein